MASLNQIKDKRTPDPSSAAAAPRTGTQSEQTTTAKTDNVLYRQAIAADALFKREYHRILSKMTSTTNGRPSTADMNEEEMQEDWSEEKYIAGLAQLERLQNQIDSLRTALPSIIHSLATPHSTPLQLYKSFKTAAITSSKNISELRQDWDSPQTNAIFARTEKSYDNNEEIEYEAMERVPEFGWVEKAGGSKAGDSRVNGWLNGVNGIKKEEEDDQEHKTSTDTVKILSDTEIRNFLEEWQTRYAGPQNQGLVIEWLEDLSRIKITYRIISGTLEFQIHPHRTLSPPIYHVKVPTRVPGLCPAMENWFSIRPRQHDLEYTLEMIRAYMNARRVKCAKCDQMIEGGIGCSVRMSKGEGVGREWIALHEKCRSGYKG